MSFKAMIFLILVTVQQTFSSNFVDEQRKKQIAIIESLCRGDFVFKNLALIIFYEKSKKFEISLDDWSSHILAAHDHIENITRKNNPNPQLFITKSSFIKESTLVQDSDEDVLFNLLKKNSEHRLSFAYLQLYSLKFNTSLDGTKKKSRETLETIIARKPTSSIKMIWKEDPSNPPIPIEPHTFDKKYEIYCQDSIPLLKAKIRANQEAARKAAQEARMAQNQSSWWCTIL